MVIITKPAGIPLTGRVLRQVFVSVANGKEDVVMLKVIKKAAIAAASLVFFVTPSTVVFAADDGDLGPHPVFNGQALDESLYAFNHHLQTQYIRDDIYAGLDVTQARDFVMIADTVSHIPEITMDITDSGFGPVISSGSSLQTALAHFNTEVLASSDDLYIQVARAETNKGLSFSAVAAVKAHNETDRALAQLNRATEWGEAVYDGLTLDSHVVALSDFIGALEEREVRLAYAVPAVNSRSFERYTLMFASLAY